LRAGRISYIAAFMTKALENMRGMLGRRVRLFLLVALALISIVVLAQIVAPMLISTAIVRASMERAIARWTGHEVSIGGTPEVSFWPEPHITLANVTIAREDDRARRVLARVERLSASFELLPALLGQPVFDELVLTRPSIFVVRDEDGRLDWSDDGLLSKAVRQAAGSEPPGAVPADLDAVVGEVAFENGSLEILDLSTNQAFRFESINGDLHWPRLSLPATIDATAQVKGRPVSFELASTQALLLLSGASASAAGSIGSDLVSGRFEGIANLASQSLLSGTFDFSTPDLPGLAAWTGRELSDAEELKSMAVHARLQTGDHVLRFEDVSLSLNDSHATGILDLARPPQGRPRLTGTLAFDMMNLSKLLAALPQDAAGDSADQEPAATLHDRLELDLRVSAREASLGPFILGDAAISLVRLAGQTRLDIADSDFEAGTLTGRLTSAKEGFSDGAAMRLVVQDADFGSIARRLNLTGPFPLTRGSLELSFSVAKPAVSAGWKDAKGEMRFTAGRGSVPGLDLAELRSLASAKTYFPLSEATGNDLDFESVEATATFDGGVAELQQGQIVSGAGTLRLSGMIPYAQNGLALSASITPPGAGAPDFTFFLGGSWPAMVVLTSPTASAPVR
jgi:AsmA protein